MRMILVKLVILAAIVLATGCQGKKNTTADTELVVQVTNQTDTAAETLSPPQESGPSSRDQSGILIVYFSTVGNTDYPEGMDENWVLPKEMVFARGTDANSSASINIQNGTIAGNTELIAEQVRERTGGDLYFIRTVKRYPLSDKETHDIGLQEQRSGERPALASEKVDMESYDTVFLGYPIWYYDLPMAVYTFLESYDFEGKTIIPFSTHGGSGEVKTVAAIGELAPGAAVGPSYTVYRNQFDIQDIQSWLEEAGLAP